MLPECWTSSYKSALVRPLLVSSLKKTSNCLNSSNVLMSNSKVKGLKISVKLAELKLHLPNPHKFINSARNTTNPPNNDNDDIHWQIKYKSGYRAHSTSVGIISKYEVLIAFELRTLMHPADYLRPASHMPSRLTKLIPNPWLNSTPTNAQ